MKSINTNLYENIKTILDEAKSRVSKVVNFAIVDAYWNIGRMIVEEEQNGADRSNYGEYLIKELSKKLTKYTLPESNNQIFASKYKIYLPTEEELKNELIRERDIIEVEKKIKE